MGTIKDRNDINLTEAEGIKKRGQQYTELYKKDLHNPDNHDGVINHLRYADDTTLMAESEEELKSLLMKVKEESEKVGLKLSSTFRKLRS